MIRSLAQALAIVEFLMDREQRSVDEAIEVAGVPLQLVDEVRRYFSDPVIITLPDLMVGIENVPLCDPDANAPQPYFSAFERFLLDERRWSRSTVETLSATATELLRRLPEPGASVRFQGRGLVVGHIQSGKTATMAALIARAADSGYKLFIILAGLWKDLRAQTQKRFDQEITGYSDNPTDAPFATHEPGAIRWVRLTRSARDGDFVAGSHNDLNPQTPKLAVLKKNVRVERLGEWLESSTVPLADLPALVIDDEADQASINTNYDEDDDEIDPSKTNGRIRGLLAILPKCVYIGFTATPFANVLIDADVPEDLYPRDFIATLREPAGYFGPRRLFGLGMEPSDLSPEPQEKPLLDVIRLLSEKDLDSLEQIRPGTPAPPCLADALLAFLLSCCGRLARGQEMQHFSMLVHPSQRTDDHRDFAEVLREELQILSAAAIRPGTFPDMLRRAREMWVKDFERVTKAEQNPDLELPAFDSLWKFARAVTDRVEIKILNYNSDDRLDYSGTPKRYIVVGGNNLSRGLTLEGLSVSFFTRNANQYDTLLQMGRWFGFRPGYHDLTRIFVGADLSERFAELARVEVELRGDLSKYSNPPTRLTPLELKPLIRSHPTMAVTSPMKMGAGRPVYISFEGRRSETVSFPTDQKGELRSNLSAGRAFVSSLPLGPLSLSAEGMHLWADLPASSVLSLLESYSFSRDATEVNGRNLVEYIRRQNSVGELTVWDVVIPRGNPKREMFKWAEGVFSRRILRSPISKTSIGVLSSPPDIQLWRDQFQRSPTDAKRGCLMLYLIDQESGGKVAPRFFDKPGDGVDILALVLLFPSSQSHQTIEYISQA